MSVIGSTSGRSSTECVSTSVLHRMCINKCSFDVLKCGILSSTNILLNHDIRTKEPIVQFRHHEVDIRAPCWQWEKSILNRINKKSISHFIFLYFIERVTFEICDSLYQRSRLIRSNSFSVEHSVMTPKNSPLSLSRPTLRPCVLPMSND